VLLLLYSLGAFISCRLRMSIPFQSKKCYHYFRPPHINTYYFSFVLNSIQKHSNYFPVYNLWTRGRVKLVGYLPKYTFTTTFSFQQKKGCNFLILIFFHFLPLEDKNKGKWIPSHPTPSLFHALCLSWCSMSHRNAFEATPLSQKINKGQDPVSHFFEVDTLDKTWVEIITSIIMCKVELVHNNPSLCSSHNTTCPPLVFPQQIWIKPMSTQCPKLEGGNGENCPWDMNLLMGPCAWY